MIVCAGMLMLFLLVASWVFAWQLASLSRQRRLLERASQRYAAHAQNDSHDESLRLVSEARALFEAAYEHDQVRDRRHRRFYRRCLDRQCRLRSS